MGGHRSSWKRRGAGTLAVLCGAAMLAVVPASTAGAGAVTLLTKWGSSGSGDSQFSVVAGGAVDAAGNVYVTDAGPDRVQKFTSDGTFITKWGSSGTGDGQFDEPVGIAIDAAGNVYVADSLNQRIQKFTSNGTFITKWGITDVSGTLDGQFDRPSGVAVDTSGNVYVADTNNDRIQRFTSDGAFVAKWGSLGTGNGQLNEPIGMATDAGGDVYVADKANSRIQKFDSTGAFLTKWGKNGGDGTSGSGDGEFTTPFGIAVDAAGAVYVADANNHRIQKFTSNGAFITKWGRNGGDGTSGSGDGEFANPNGVAIDAAGNAFVVEQGNFRVQKFAQYGSLSVVLNAVPNDAQDFLFGTGTPFVALDDDANATRSNTWVTPNLTTGLYSVGQNAVPGWVLSSIACNTEHLVSLTNRRVLVALDPLQDATCTFTDVKQLQPDLQINVAGPVYLGNNVYNATGAGQSVTRNTQRTKKASILFKVSNDSLHTDTFKLLGTGTSTGVTVKYFHQVGATFHDVTTSVKLGTHAMTLGAGTTQNMRVDITVAATTAVGTVRSFLVKATSQGGTGKVDAIKAGVKVV